MTINWQNCRVSASALLRRPRTYYVCSIMEADLWLIAVSLNYCVASTEHGILNITCRALIHLASLNYSVLIKLSGFVFFLFSFTAFTPICSHAYPIPYVVSAYTWLGLGCLMHSLHFFPGDLWKGQRCLTTNIGVDVWWSSAEKIIIQLASFKSPLFHGIFLNWW